MRASRLLSLLMLLQARGRMTAQQLAGELEVSVRTIYRDMESLSSAGVPVYADRGPDGGYQLLDGYRTRLTGLTSAEAAALFLSGLPGPAAELGLGGLLADAQLKLLAALPPEPSTQAARIRERFHLDAPGWMTDPEEVPFLSAVADAVWEARRIWIRYLRWKQPREVERTLDPLGLVNKAGHWYLVARDPAAPAGDPAGAPRVYRAARILELRQLPEEAQRPDGFDLAAFWRDYFDRYRSTLYTGTARIRLTENGLRRAPILLQSAMGQAAQESAGPADSGGWHTATVPIESVRHGLVEFLKLGPDVEVLDPPELREMLTAAIRDMAEMYGV
jgi:predicted DNA-binding transcriptional regulator YafY